MKFTFLTLFPHLISGYFEDSILKRAVLNNLIDIEIINYNDNHILINRSSETIIHKIGILFNIW